MKILKKIFGSLLTFTVVLVGILFVTNQKLVQVAATTNTETKVIIHYYRYAGDESAWSLWLWELEPTSGSGASYNFAATKDDYGAYFEFDLATYMPDATAIGIIVKKGSWVAKDIDSDRTLDLKTAPKDVNGNYNFYLVQGEEEIFTDIDKAKALCGNKFLSTYFSDATETTSKITFTTASPSGTTKDNIKLYADDEEVTYTNFSFSNGSGSLVINEKVDFGKEYVLVGSYSDGTNFSKDVSFDGIYDSQIFEEAYTYQGSDLGANYSKAETTFKLWSPTATSVKVLLYKSGHPKQVSSSVYREDGTDTPYETKELTYGEYGVWSVTVDGDLNGIYYTYEITNGTKSYEITDPYTKTCGVSVPGSSWTIRGMVIDFDSTNPADWNTTTRPNFSGTYTDAIIYELHVRDLSSSSTWNGTEGYRGKLMAFTVHGTTYSDETGTYQTGIDSIIDLGITHIQILPLQQNGILDGSRVNDEDYQTQQTDGIFNWGYMTNLYNCIEGTYSTDPYDGFARVRELKQVITELHKNGISVNMDVVYNHTAFSDDQNFNRIVPGYYHRLTTTGAYSNGSGCGNEVASERSMVRSFIVDSLDFWTNEYKIDGYRFDLMALEDVDTMNAVYESLLEYNANIMVYGEPWTGGTTVLATTDQATKATMNKMPSIACFNDTFRDGAKGSVFNASEKGWVQGTSSSKPNVLFGVVGGDTTYSNIASTEFTYLSASQSINYVECHDNLCLYDKLISSGASATTARAMQTQAISLVLTSMGVPFLQAGCEFLRTKQMDENSYNKSDSINQIDWSLRATNADVYDTVKELIQIRKDHASFRMSSYDEIEEKLTILDTSSTSLIAYEIVNEDDYWSDILVIHANASFKTGSVGTLLGNNEYVVLYSSNTLETYSVVGDEFTGYVKPNETVILGKVGTIGTKPVEGSPKGCGCGTTELTTQTIIGTSLLGIALIGFAFVITPKKTKEE